MPSLEILAIRAALEVISQQCDALEPPLPPYRALSDRIVRPKPTLPTLGPAGFTFTDPTFGSRMLRVTDGVSRPGRSYRVPSNTHLAAWSADSLKFTVMGPDWAEVYSFDAARFRSEKIGVAISQCEPTWSRSDPSALFVVGGPMTRTLRRFDAALSTYTNILDLDSLGLPNLLDPRTYVGAIVSAGSPELIAVMFGGTGQDHHYLVSLVTPDGVELQRLNTRERLGVDLHSLGLDLSGRYVTLYPVGGHPSNTIVWDTQADTCTVVTASPWGHDALGYGVQTNADVASGPWDARQWCVRSLTDLSHPTNLVEVPTPKEIYTADHQSWNNAKPDARVPVLSSTYRSGAGIGQEWRLWVDEILMVSTDGSGVVYRFAHNRSIASTYLGQPIAHVSPDGTACIVQTNWEGTLGADTNEGGYRTDVMLVELT